MSIKKLDNQAELLARLALGDERAFEVLYYHYAPRLLPFVDRMLRNRRTSEEIVQEIFISLWTRRELMATVEHPSSYIFNMASNRTLDYQRKIASDRRLLEKVTATATESDNGTQEQLAYNESAAIVREAIESLPAQRRIIYELSRNEGLSHEQIASQLGISKSTVANQMVSALKQIRAFMEKRSGLFSYAVFFLLTRR